MEELTLYKNIRELRIAKGMSQMELAKLTGYTDRSSIAKIEKGEVDLQRSKIVQFAKALGVMPGDLLDAELDPADFVQIHQADEKDMERLRAYHNATKNVQNVIDELLSITK